MEPKELLFNLDKPFRFSKKGEFEECFQLDIDPPSYNNYQYAARLAQYFTRVLLSGQKNYKDLADDNAQQDDQAAQEDLMKPSLIRILLLGSDVDIVRIMKCFDELAYASCWLDRENRIKIKPAHREDIDFDSWMLFMCTYIATFIVPSVLSDLQNMGGNQQSPKEEFGK